MITRSKKTFLLLVCLAALALGLLFLRLNLFKPPAPSPSPSPIAPPRLYQKRLSVTSVSLPADLVLPSQTPTYTVTAPTVTADQIQSLATSLGIVNPVTTIADPIQGTIYRATDTNQTLKLIVASSQLSYFNNLTPPTTGFFPNQDLTQQIIRSFLDKLPPDWQPQGLSLLNQTFFQSGGGEYLPASSDTALILEASFSTLLLPSIDSSPATLTVRLTRRGDIRSLNLTLPLQFAPSSQQLPLKTPADIISAFPQEATFMDTEAFADLNRLDSFSVTSVSLSYHLPRYQETLAQPIFILIGTVSAAGQTFPATAIIPAIKSEFLSPR